MGALTIISIGIMMCRLWQPDLRAELMASSKNIYATPDAELRNLGAQIPPDDSKTSEQKIACLLHDMRQFLYGLIGQAAQHKAWYNDPSLETLCNVLEKSVAHLENRLILLRLNEE